jgi:hypothetical protein
MNSRSRKKKQNGGMAMAVVQPEPVGMKKERLSLDEAMFHPIMHSSSMGTGSPDFDIHVPFLVKGGNVFLLHFMDSCGDMALYTEMWGVGSKWMDGFEDALPAIRDCLEVQEMTGVQYYLEKVDRAVGKWLYALQLLADKGLLEKERALELARELGMAEKAMADARTAIDMKIEQARQRRDALKASPSASESMMAFLEQMGTAKEEDGGTVRRAFRQPHRSSNGSGKAKVTW